MKTVLFGWTIKVIPIHPATHPPTNSSSTSLGLWFTKSRFVVVAVGGAQFHSICVPFHSFIRSIIYKMNLTLCIYICTCIHCYSSYRVVVGRRLLAAESELYISWENCSVLNARHRHRQQQQNQQEQRYYLQLPFRSSSSILLMRMKKARRRENTPSVPAPNEHREGNTENVELWYRGWIV